jgi:hypothetical protein
VAAQYSIAMTGHHAVAVSQALLATTLMTDQVTARAR